MAFLLDNALAPTPPHLTAIAGRIPPPVDPTPAVPPGPRCLTTTAALVTPPRPIVVLVTARALEESATTRAAIVVDIVCGFLKERRFFA